MSKLSKIIWCINLILLIGCSMSLYTNCNRQTKPEMIVCQKDTCIVDSIKIDTIK